jgi:hypothetical protein
MRPSKKRWLMVVAQQQLVDMGFSRSCATVARAATGDGDTAACAD